MRSRTSPFCSLLRLPLPLVLLQITSSFSFGQTNVLTYRNDNQRTGQNTTETILTPANVTPANFGKLFNISLDGKVDAQPLYVAAVKMPGYGTRSVVYAATEHATVYAFDPNSSLIFWHVSLLASGETPSDARNCDQVTPEIGITGTPVIDLNAGTHGVIYLIAMSKDASGNYYQRLHALDITTGAEQFGGPTTVAATYPGSGDNSSNGQVVLDPKQVKSRTGILLQNGILYTGWGSHCDIRPYTGWLIGYNESNLQQTTVFNFAPNGHEAALWGSGGGVAADSAGNIFTNVANGSFDTNLNSAGFPSQGDFGNAFVKLTTTNGLAAADYWTMDNTQNESGGDVDLGSGGVLLLPDLVDTNGSTRHLGTGAGKDGNIYVFDRDNMGKFDSANNGTLYQELSSALPYGEWGSPAWFNGTVYYGGNSDVIRAFPVTAARLSGQPSSTTAQNFAYPGSTPSVSANGAGSAILWAFQNSSTAVLHAYDATNLGNELYNSNQAGNGRDQFGAGNKFIVPTIADGKVFVGTTNSVAIFGLFSSGPLLNGNYRITSAASGLVLDDPAFSKTPGTRIIEWPSNSGDNQNWHFAVQPNGLYTIQNVSSGLFLTDPSGSTTPGAPLQQQTATGDASQLWQLSASGSARIIRNSASILVIDDPKASARPGTGMQVWPANGRVNQSWFIQ